MLFAYISVQHVHIRMVNSETEKRLNTNEKENKSIFRMFYENTSTPSWLLANECGLRKM